MPVLNQDKARAYLKEYTTNGYNKTKAHNTINPKATYRSNNNNSTAFHRRVMINNDLVSDFKLDSITPEYIIGEIVKVYASAVKPADKLRAQELLGKFKQLFNDNVNIQSNIIYNSIDIKDLDRLQLARDHARIPHKNTI